MPPRKSFPKRRKFTKRRNAGVVALRKVNRMAAAIEPKKSNATTLHVPTNISSGGIVIPLTLVAQGTAYNQRTGLQLVAKSIQMSGRVSMGLTAGVPAQTVRLIMFYDRQEVAGTSPVLNQMLDPNTLSTIMAPYSDFNRLHVGRFQVMKSVRYVLDLNRPTRQFKLRLNFRKLHKCFFDGSGAGNTVRGTVYFAAVSDTNLPAEGGIQPQLVSTIQFIYLDD
ncbi:MAG: hypothetical protein [Cressdnaviricota sp.]|nr:MAG: hypothetical protein [Cressdnaviricota sp.]